MWYLQAGVVISIIVILSRIFLFEDKILCYTYCQFIAILIVVTLLWPLVMIAFIYEIKRHKQEVKIEKT